MGHVFSSKFKSICPHEFFSHYIILKTVFKSHGELKNIACMMVQDIFTSNTYHNSQTGWSTPFFCPPVRFEYYFEYIAIIIVRKQFVWTNTFEFWAENMP